MTAVDWRPLAGALVASLEATGVLTEPVWRQAFAETPRHLFVPCFLEQRGDAERLVDGSDGVLRHQLGHPGEGVGSRERGASAHQFVEHAQHHELDAPGS